MSYESSRQPIGADNDARREAASQASSERPTEEASDPHSAELWRKKADQRLKTEAIDRLRRIDLELVTAIGAHNPSSEAEALGVIDDQILDRFICLNDVIDYLVNWRDYIPASNYEALVHTIIRNAFEIKRVIADYQASAGSFQPGMSDAKRAVFAAAAGLRQLSPDIFSGDLIRLDDNDFLDLGSGGRQLRDGRNEERKLLAQARLVVYDSKRFRTLFRSRYNLDLLGEHGRHWEQWDRYHPTAVPRCLPAWKQIEKALIDDS